MKWWDQMAWSSFFESWGLSQLFTLLWLSSKNSLVIFAFCYKGGVICIAEVTDISLGCLDSSLCFIQTCKRSVFIPVPKKGNPKECSNYRTIALISHASKVMLKILQARLHQYMNWELPDVQIGFRKGRGTRNQIANICWIIKKFKRVPEKHLFLLYWLCQSLRLCGSQ